MPEVKLHAEKFEVLIARRGRDVEWRQAVMCSCWNPLSGQPNYQCKVCKGKGYTYEDPIICRALVTSIVQNKEFQDMAGVFDVGDAIMTVPKRMWKRLPNGQWNMKEYEIVPMFYVGMYDLITLTDDEVRSSEVLVRNRPIYERPADTLLNEHVTGIHAVRHADPDTGVLTVYQRGVDFEVVGNRIDWLPGGNAPADGEQYSVVYWHRPVYTVLTTLPKPRHQDGQDLPRYVALRYRAGGFEPK